MNIGLYFGSFNPIHIGHLIIANHMVEFINLEEIWFIVSPCNPFKNNAFLLPGYHRLKMVSLAINDFKKMKVLDIEFNLPQPSYTFNTLSKLKKRNPIYNFSIIIGSDTLISFNKWKNFEKILYNYPIYVYPRLNYQKKIKINIGNIYQIKAPIIDISASFIRKSINIGKNIKPLIPLKAWEYLIYNSLYKEYI